MVIDDLSKYRIILASRSPRRQQLLTELGLKFEVLVREYPESYPKNLSGHEIKDNEIVITADTIVWCNGSVLDKPVDREDAIAILAEIGGTTHEVITGVCILSSAKEITFSDTTKVTFEKLSEDEISYYVDRFKPYDKAGAYGIQEWIGLAACSRIEGSYFNVVGLPVQRLYKELQRFVM